MMRKPAIGVLFLSGCAFCASQAESSKVELSNGILEAALYLPDSEEGYYRGTRFDWSGLISGLEYEGHTYFGRWFDEDSPTKHEDVMGPMEAFSPLNYEDTVSGERFVQIGVGAMTKPSDEGYSSFNAYSIVDPGRWTIESEVDEITFTQVLSEGGISFAYTKTVQLVPNRPQMVISHTLRNSGEDTIESTVFNHNFFVLDGQPIDRGVVLTFPVEVSGRGRGLGDVYQIEGNRIVFLRGLKAGESFACKYLEGLTGVEDFAIRVENLHTGAGVRITGDHPLSRLRLWGNARTVCPETYLEVTVEPGEEFSWEYRYEFYLADGHSQPMLQPSISK